VLIKSVLSPAIPAIPWHGSCCLHSQTLQHEIQTNQLLRKGKRERPAQRSRVLLEKPIVAQLYRPLTVSLWNSKVHCHINPVQYSQHILLGFIWIRILPSTSWSTEMPHTIRLCNWIFYYTSLFSYAQYMLRYNLIVFFLNIDLLLWDVQMFTWISLKLFQIPTSLHETSDLI
jgi:hypothetical protein